MPIFSEPAIGCDPTKTAPVPAQIFSHWEHIAVFTLPTSVRIAPPFRFPEISAATTGILSVGVHNTIKSALAAAQDGDSQTSSKIFGKARHFSLVDSLRDHAFTFFATPRAFSARANEAPKSPVPRIATVSIKFIVKDLSIAPDSLNKILSKSHSLLKINFKYSLPLKTPNFLILYSSQPLDELPTPQIYLKAPAYFRCPGIFYLIGNLKMPHSWGRA